MGGWLHAGRAHQGFKLRPLEAAGDGSALSTPRDRRKARISPLASARAPPTATTATTMHRRRRVVGGGAGGGCHPCQETAPPPPPPACRLPAAAAIPTRHSNPTMPTQCRVPVSATKSTVTSALAAAAQWRAPQRADRSLSGAVRDEYAGRAASGQCRLLGWQDGPLGVEISDLWQTHNI